MSDLTPEVLDELERLERERPFIISGQAIIASPLALLVETHARDLIEAARERDRLREEVLRLKAITSPVYVRGG